MATLNISVPDAMKTFVHEQAAKRGFGTVSEYVRAIIRDIQEREDQSREVRGKLLDAVRGGPATPLTRQDWDGIRREVHQRHAQRQGRTNGSKGTGSR